MRRVGISRPNKRPRPTEENIAPVGPVPIIETVSNSPREPEYARSNNSPLVPSATLDGGGTTSQFSQGVNVLHSTAIGTPSKRVALVDPLALDSDDEILLASPIPASRSFAFSQVKNTSQRLNPKPSQSQHHGPPAAPAKGLGSQVSSQLVLQSQRRGRGIPIVINAPTGYPDFSNVLQECGYILSTPPARNYIQKSELMFRKELNNWIEERFKDEPQGIMNAGTKFISAMRTYLSTQMHLRHSMTPTQHPDFVPQRSLLHNLLCIPAIQPYILEIIFPALAEACYSAGGNQETVDMLVSIVQQLRWLPKIVDAERFVSTILDFVKTGTAVAQKQLIASLPEIIPEDKHQKIADALRILLEKPQEREVVPAIMDCFSSLDVPSKEWMKVHEAALSQMFNSPLSHYPAFFAFLFRTEDTSILSETISNMREKLEITPLGERDVKNPVYMVEIVEKVRFCAAVNPHLTQIWVKQLKAAIDLKEDVRSIDLIMLLIFSEYSKSPVAALNLIFSNRDMAIPLFDDLLKNNLPILNQVFKTLLNICCLAIRNKEKDTHTVMEHILTNLFLRLSLIEGQEIAFRLSNFLVESTASREASLRVLTALAVQNPERLLHFSAHLMSVVASVMRYPYGQIKQLMNVLAMLANVDRNRSSESFASELAIFLRKQLTHFSDTTRCFGVLGTLATVKQMCQKQTSGGKIKEFLDLVWSLVEREEDACLLFLDELSEITNDLPEIIRKKFESIMARKFQEYWTTSEDGATRKNNDEVGIRLSESFDANRELVKEHLFISFQEKPLAMSPIVAPSHLRLVARLVSAQKEDDLSDIDAILGCPVILPDMESYYTDTKKLNDCTYDQKKKLGRYLCLTINFFRESISAFVSQKDPELRIKIWLRLANVAYLQQLLVKTFHYFPVLSKAYIDEISVANRCGASASASATVGAGKQKPREEMDSTLKHKTTKSAKTSKKELDKSKGKKDLNQSMNQTKKSNKGAEDLKNLDLENVIQPKLITPYLRRFDVQVFSCLLKFPLNDGPAIDFTVVAQNITSSPNQQVVDVAKFTPETLAMLLVEIHQQTKNTNSAFNVLSVKNIVPAICSHMDNIESLYERKKMSKDDEAHFEACFRLLLHTFRLILEGIQSHSKQDRQELLHKVIEKVVKRIKNPPSESEVTFADKLNNAASYFANFSKSVKFPSTAVEHLLLLKQLDDLAKDDRETVPYIENVSREYLAKEWDLLPPQVDTILKTWLKKAARPLDVLQEITRSLIPDDDDIPCTETYQSCSRTNFHVWYSTLMSSLASHVSKCGRIAAADEVFEFWNTAVLVLKDLVTVIQKFRENRFLLPLLKHTRQFFEALNTHCVKKLPALIVRDSEDTKKFIKSLQHVTRKVQIVCAHSKVEKDTHLLRFVPLLRKVLESLVFRVRESLAGSGLAGAFILGSLKHKDIDGEVLNSQPYNINEDSDSNDGDDDANSSELLLTNAAQLPVGQEEDMDLDDNEKEDEESSSAPEQQADDDQDMFQDEEDLD